MVLPVRNAVTGQLALDRIRAEVPGAQVSSRPLDLSSLTSVAGLARTLLAEDRPIHLLQGDPSRSLDESVPRADG